MSSLQASSVGRRGVFPGTVGANEQLCDEHALVRIVVDNFPQTRPGQFVQLRCRPLGEQAGAIKVQLAPDRPPRFTQAELTDKEPLLRRPLSLAAVARGHGRVELDIIYRTIGAGTRWLWRVEPGTQVSILGPLGNGFSIRAGKAHAALVAGGVGIPPMLYLAASLAEAGRGVTTFSGVRSANLMPLTIAAAAAPDKAGRPNRCIEQFNARGAESVLATDDGSAGYPGLIGDAFAGWLDAYGPRADDLVVYTCGPEPLMRAVGELCISRGIECQLALERHMACGIGTCQSCVVKIRDEGGSGWSYKLCCSDGPVFDARLVIWE